MSWPALGGYLATFVAGIVAKVLADEWAERRRAGRQRSTTDQRFARIDAAMPAFLQEVRTDLAGDSLVREFVTLPSPHNHFNHGTVDRFEYYEASHDDLPSKLAMLENVGYIRDVGKGNHPIWRMSEEFVQLLTRS